MPVIRVYTGPSTYKELDLDDYYVKNTNFIDALRTPDVYMRNLRLYGNGVPTSNLGDPSIAEMAMIPEQFDNKLAFYDISKIKFYTSNDKITWTEFVVSDDNKRKLVGGDTSYAPLRIPAGTPHFRIEIEAGSYCYLNALYSYWDSQGNRVKVKIQKRNCSTLAWKQHTDSDVYVSSWPGHLFLPFETIPFRYDSTDSYHHNAIRIDIVDIDWIYPENAILFYCLQIWGGFPAGKRTIYSVDEYKRTTFPAEVKATTFKRSSDNVEVSYKDHNHLLSHLSDIAFTPLSGGQMLIYTPEGGGKWVNFTPNFALGSHTHSASDINSGTLDSARIPNLSASKITSGTLDSARIPNLSASKITSGTLSSDRLPSIPFNLLPVGTAANTVAQGNHTHSTLSNLTIDGILEISPPGGGGHLPMLQLDAVTGLQFVGRYIPDAGLYASNYTLLAPVNDTSIQNNVLILPNGSGTLARLSDVPDTTDFADAEHEHDFSDIKDIRWGNKDLDAVLNDVYNFADGKAPRNHTHSASDINSGTLNSARIPNLSASKITSGTLSSDRLPSIPFNLLPVGTSSNTVAQGNHTHGIADIFNYVDRGLQLLRTKPSSLTSVGSGTDPGSVTLNSSLSSGTPIFIEVNTSSNYTAMPKIIGVTVGGTTIRASATGEEYIAGWSTFDGTDFHIYTFSVWYSDDTLYFGAKRYIRGNFKSSAINWTTSTYTLYVGRVWKLPIN